MSADGSPNAATLAQTAEPTATAAAAVSSTDSSLEQHEAQMSVIEAEVMNRPLIAPVEPLVNLLPEYSNNQQFTQNIQIAARSYPNFRRVRGDGSCFYRAYLFGVLCWISRTMRAKDGDGNSVNAEKEKAQALQKAVEDSLSLVLAHGYERFTMEDFHECFLDLFQWTIQNKPSDEEIVGKLKEDGVDAYMVAYARFLTSSSLQDHAAEYSPFISDGRSMVEFRRQDVEPTHREADSLQILALTTFMQVGVRIVYLDRNTTNNGKNSSSSEGGSGSDSSAASEQLPSYDFPEGSEPKVHLLYRPGHYDVLQVTS